MRIIALGSKLEEISIEEFIYGEQPEPEEFLELDYQPETVNRRKRKKRKSVVFITGSEEAQEALRLADMNYEGGIDLKSVEFCKVETQQSCLAGTLHIPRLSDVCGKKICIMFFINSKHIVIIDDSNFSETLIVRIKQSINKQGQTKERFLYNFFSQFMSRDLVYLGRYEKRIMKMEEDVMEDNIDEFQDHMLPIRRDLLVLREYYDELRDLGKELEENTNRFFNKKDLRYFGIINDRADRLMGRTMHLLDYLGQVRQTYESQVAEQQNKNMQFLTIISTIFFPLTLITGWYGMNFKNMPGLENGYPLVVLACLIIVGVSIWLFKKKKLL